MDVRSLHLTGLVRQLDSLQVQLRACIRLGTQCSQLDTEAIPFCFYTTARRRIGGDAIIIVSLLVLRLQCFQATLLVVLIIEERGKFQGERLSSVDLRLSFRYLGSKFGLKGNDENG